MRTSAARDDSFLAAFFARALANPRFKTTTRSCAWREVDDAPAKRGPILPIGVGNWQAAAVDRRPSGMGFYLQRALGRLLSAAREPAPTLYWICVLHRPFIRP